MLTTKCWTLRGLGADYKSDVYLDEEAAKQACIELDKQVGGMGTTTAGRRLVLGEGMPDSPVVAQERARQYAIVQRWMSIHFAPDAPRGTPVTLQMLKELRDWLGANYP